MAVPSAPTARPAPLPPPPPPPPALAGPPAWRRPALLGGLAVAGTVLLGVGDPNTTHVPLCPLQALTGIDCPACGSLRAVHGLAHLDVVDAFGHNALFTVAAPFLVAIWVVWMARALGRPVLAGWSWPTWTKPALLVVALVFAVARNLEPFAYLGSA